MMMESGASNRVYITGRVDDGAKQSKKTCMESLRVRSRSVSFLWHGPAFCGSTFSSAIEHARRPTGRLKAKRERGEGTWKLFLLPRARGTIWGGIHWWMHRTPP